MNDDEIRQAISDMAKAIAEIRERLARQESDNSSDQTSQAIHDIRKDIQEIKERLAHRESAFDRWRDAEAKAEAMKEELVELRTKFAIVWAGLAVVGTTGLGGLVTAILAFQHFAGHP